MLMNYILYVHESYTRQFRYFIGTLLSISPSSFQKAQLRAHSTRLSYQI